MFYSIYASQTFKDCGPYVGIYSYEIVVLFCLNIICFSSIVKKASSLFLSFSSPLPGTHQYWCLMEKHGRDPDWARTHDPWDETP